MAAPASGGEPLMIKTENKDKPNLKINQQYLLNLCQITNWLSINEL